MIPETNSGADSSAPVYAHTCARCQFLGSMSCGGQRYDLYVCGTAEMRSVSARYGDAAFEMVAADCSDMNDGYPQPLVTAKILSDGLPVEGSADGLTLAETAIVEKGPRIGSFRDSPIFAWVRTRKGLRFRFDGISSQRRAGDAHTLFLGPGLLYALES